MIDVTANPKPFNWNIALWGSILSALFMGFHGFHRLYIGQIERGVMMCLTCGGCFIWSVIDWINMEKIIEGANKKAGWLEQPQHGSVVIHASRPIYPGSNIHTFS